MCSSPTDTYEGSEVSMIGIDGCAITALRIYKVPRTDDYLGAHFLDSTCPS